MTISNAELNTSIPYRISLISNQSALHFEKVKAFSESYIVSCALQTLVLSSVLSCFGFSFATTVPICFTVIVCKNLINFALCSVKAGINALAKKSLYCLTKTAQVINDIFKKLYEWICSLSFRSPSLIAMQKFQATYPIPHITLPAMHEEVIDRVLISPETQLNIAHADLPIPIEEDTADQCSEDQSATVRTDLPIPIEKDTTDQCSEDQSATVHTDLPISIEEDTTDQCSEDQSATVHTDLPISIEKDVADMLPGIQFSAQVINSFLKDKTSSTERPNILRSYILNYKGIIEAFDMNNTVYSFNKYNLNNQMKPMYSPIPINHNKIALIKKPDCTAKQVLGTLKPNNFQALNGLKLGIKLLHFAKR